MRLTPDLDPPSEFIIEWRARSKSNPLPWQEFSKLAVVNGATRLFVVKNLKADNDIQFRIRASNNRGPGFPGYMVSGLTCITNSKSKYYTRVQSVAVK